jgi:hypothetical protein
MELLNNIPFYILLPIGFLIGGVIGYVDAILMYKKIFKNGI